MVVVASALDAKPGNRGGLPAAVLCLTLGALGCGVSAHTTAQASNEERTEPRHKAGYQDDSASFGSPNTAPRMLLEEDIRTQPLFRFPEIDDAMESWYETKARVNNNYGLKFGLDYTYLYQQLSDSLGQEDDASVGISRLYGEWTLSNAGRSNKGRLVFKIDHRHKIGTELTPSELGSEAGYIGQTGVLFNDIGFHLIDFNWQQSFSDGSGLIAGRYDPMDYISVLGYANPWTSFSNLAILLNPAVAFPDASYGLGGGAWLSDQWYVKGAVNDANGTLENYQFFRDGAEFFKWGEVGWSPGRSERYTTNIHIAAWHVDEREEVGIDSAEGIMLGANWTTDDLRWMWFTRAGWADGDAALYDETYSLGFMRKFRRNADLVGMAVNWGQPPQDGLDAQITGEVFYRVQLSENLAITPSLQLLKDPALNHEEDAVWVSSLRLRLTL